MLTLEHTITTHPVAWMLNDAKKESLSRIDNDKPPAPKHDTRKEKELIMTYNGWTNWETWNLNLWLSNDESTQRACEAFCSARSIEDAAAGLRAMMEGDLEALDMPSGFFRDALLASLGEVDWRELAAAFMAEEA